MLNPINEVKSQHKLTVNYLREVSDASIRGDWRGAVANDQLSTDNAAKSITAGTGCQVSHTTPQLNSGISR